MLGILHAFLFLSSVEPFQEYHQLNSLNPDQDRSNSLNPDQARHFVRPGLDPNCLQMLSADDKNHH